MSRYQRLLDLSTFSQEKLYILHSKKVLIIGAGGVGQHVSTYLITNGIVDLTIVDFDKVEISNLNRQILLTENDIGLNKVDVVKKALESRNKDAKVKALNLKVNGKNIDSLIKDFDVIVDAVDNWDTKFVISDACKSLHKLLLHVGVDGESGQYCLFKNKSLSDFIDYNIIGSPRDGVIGSMVGAVSCLATNLLIRYLVKDSIESDILFSFDLVNNKITKIKI